MLTQRAKNDAFVFRFDSMREVLEICNPVHFAKQKAEFTGEQDLTTWEDIIGRSEKAWNYGHEVLNACLEKLKDVKIPEIKSHARRTKFNAEGDGDMDWERMYEGNPNMFRKSEREQSSGPVEVTIMIDTTAPYHVEVEDIFWRGAAAIALARLLEEKEYRCEIWAVNGGRMFAGENTPSVVGCRIKRCGAPMDSDTIINTLSGWFYRTAMFTVLKSICDAVGKENMGAGIALAYTPVPMELDVLSRDDLRIYSAGVLSLSSAVSLMIRETTRIAEQAKKWADEDKKKKGS